MIQTCQLDNGIRVILEPVDYTEVVSIGFWQLHGSRDENKSERGYSHFLEHMLFKGTSKRTVYQIASEVERVGGFLNAFTEKELTCLYCTLPGEHRSLAIEILSDMITNSILNKEEIEKEKLVIINEINSIEDNPDEKGHEFYLEQMWKDHPLSRRITGKISQIRQITRCELMDFFKERYNSLNIVITASGKLIPDEMLNLLQKKLPNGRSSNFHADRTPPVRHLSWKLIRDKFQQIHIYSGICYSIPGIIKQYFKELVFSTLFGESMSSRLFQRLRDNEGLCYTIYTFRTYYSDTALWTIYANTLPESVPKFLNALNKELKRCLLEPPDKREVENAKSQIKGNLTLAREDMENRMKRLMRQYILTGQVLEYKESLHLLEEVLPEDIYEVIERIIKPNNFNLLVYGSRKLKSLNCTGYNF